MSTNGSRATHFSPTREEARGGCRGPRVQRARRATATYFFLPPVPPWWTWLAALVLLVRTGSVVAAVTVAVLLIVPTLPETWASMTNVATAPAGITSLVQVTLWIGLL